MGERNVAVSGHFHHVNLRLHLQQLLQHPYHHRDRDGRGVTQIEDPIRRFAPFLPPGSGAPTRRIQRRNTPFHDVVNVGEIPGQIFPVLAPVDGDGLPLEDISGK
ncbi:unnamed protein product [Cuscuta europaea]|uniref:Uncharacterized protein n=1 Tax=Cuscuta europaea TaxID=41803 RepID=A0A9P1EJR0_CUSEU|nr:unnamed protein product [Cuscuta europaea]